MMMFLYIMGIALGAAAYVCLAIFIALQVSYKPEHTVLSFSVYLITFVAIITAPLAAFMGFKS